MDLDNGEYWIGYDDVESFSLKAKFINYLDIAGGMVWSIDTDDFRGDYHDKKFPMLHVRHNSKKGLKLSQSVKTERILFVKYNQSDEVDEVDEGTPKSKLVSSKIEKKSNWLEIHKISWKVRPL